MDIEKFPLHLEVKDLHPVSDGYDPHGLFVSNVLRHENERGETVAYFLENMEYYEKRANTYGYSDDAVRWALLCRGTLEFLRQSDWQPDIIIGSDWQAGLIPNYLRTEYKNDPKLSRIATIFTIHNLSYQGMFDYRFVNEMDYDSGHERIPEFDNPRLTKLNFMRRGIMYADVISTVSPTYAREITTSEYGELLNDLLSERQSRLFGILNGIDYEFYNPGTDPFIDFKYGISNLDQRLKNKSLLRKKFNLSAEKDVPLFGIVSRLTDQKGFGLLFDTARPLLNNLDFQLVILGTGDSDFISFFHDLINEYPLKIAGHLSFDDALSHLILGGADAILIPSRFEPCGLTQMEAMRYGVVPIARKTGGLADSIVDYDPKTNSGTGFLFGPFDQYAFYGTMVRAIETYKYPKVWQGIQKRTMKADFSWTNSAREYMKLFKEAISFHNQR
jgi:starch synthase